VKAPDHAQSPSSQPDAWLVVGGQAMSTVGDSMLLVLLPLVVLDLTGSPLQVSLVVVLTQLPSFLGFLAGRPRRRFGPRRLLVAYDLVRTGLLVAVAAALGLSTGLLPVVYVLVFGTNFVTALFRPTRIELITYLAPASVLRRFNSYDRTFEALATAGGAALGGYAYAYLPLPLSVTVAAATFGLSALALVPVREPAEPPSTPATAPGEPATEPGEPAEPGVGASFWAVLTAVRRRAVPAYLLASETFTGLAFGIFLAVFVVYSRRHLGVSPVTFGHFEMVQALAATAAGVLLGSARIPLTDGRLAILGYFGMGATILVLGVNSVVWVVFPLMVSLGVTNMLYAVAVRTLLQNSVARHELIHVFALESILSRAALIAGATAAGAVLSFGAVPVGATLVAAGLIVLAVAAAGYRVLAAPTAGGELQVVARDG
jgi:MFS family permease